MSVTVEGRRNLDQKSPSQARSERMMLPWVNCCLIPFRMVPEPIDRSILQGEVAKISPNSARLRLKPVVPTCDIVRGSLNIRLSAIKTCKSCVEDISKYLFEFFNCADVDSAIICQIDCDSAVVSLTR